MRVVLPVLLVFLAGCGQMRESDVLGGKPVSASTALRLDELTACAAQTLDVAAVQVTAIDKRRPLFSAAIEACPDALAAAIAGYQGDFWVVGAPHVFDQEAAVAVRSIVRNRLAKVPHAQG
jgi:hypothetical protein